MMRENNPEANKAILLKANEAVTQGDHEAFLSFCTEDTEWNFLGDQVLRGKQAVREYMTKAYVEAPRFNTERLVAEDHIVTAIGRISLKEDGQWNEYDYCDIWEIRDGKLDKLKAFVVPVKKS